MINHILLQTAIKVETTINKYGDQVFKQQKTMRCRFRRTTELDRNNNREVVMSTDALLWLDTKDTKEGDIFYVENQYWRVEEVVDARSMYSTEIQFQKCTVNKFVGVIS